MSDESTEPQPNDQSPDAGQSAGASPDGSFPRRRRRAALQPEQPAEPTAEKSHDDSPAEAAAATDESKSTSDDTASPASTPEAEAEKTGADAPEGGDEVSPGQRVVRIILILAIAAVGWKGVLAPLARKQSRNSTKAQLRKLPKPRKKMDQTKGNQVAEKLEEEIAAGNQDAVIARTAALRKTYVNNASVQQALLKAETIKAILTIAAALDELPTPSPQDPATPIADNIRKLEKRENLLLTLQGHLTDWGDVLVANGRTGPVYTRYAPEIAAVRQDLDNWRAGLKHLRAAKALLKKKTPGFEAAAARLGLAQGFLPLASLSELQTNSRLLGQVDYFLRYQVVDRAVRIAKQVDPKVLSVSVKGNPTNIQAIQQALHAAYGQFGERLADWDMLTAAYNKGRKQHSEGAAKDAIATFSQALGKADAKNGLTQELRQKISSRLEHYQTIEAAWEKALAAKKEKNIKTQLKAWSRYHKTLNKEDGFYRAKFLAELRLIKNSIQEQIAGKYGKMIEAGRTYKPITLSMRRPESPRDPFARQARTLQGMVAEAEKVTALADVVANWNLGDVTDQQVLEARNIIGEHNDQAKILYNLYQSYKKGGKIPLARECLIRVVLLGNAKSNPWYTEAYKLVYGKKPGEK